MSDDFQITIPDLEDDNPQTIPFGRPHGFGGFGASSGQDSPTNNSTPMPAFERGDRDYFHSREDSIASEDSSQSFRHAPSKSSTAAFHSSSSSLATAVSSSFTRKASFASIRNAFKSGKIMDAPPVPQIDHQAYPVLKNPFNRSNTSLTHALPPTTRRPSVTASPPQPRPSTPNEPRHPRGGQSRSRGHSVTRSQHSHSGSVFHNSENGSDNSNGYPRQSSPPPVPRVPNGFGGHAVRVNTPPLDDVDDKVVMDPRTPSDFALHAVFMRFATTAEMKIDKFLRQSLDRDPPLDEFMGPGVDPQFDGLLNSLGKIAQKHTKPVVDSVMRWRKSHNESPSADILRRHTSQSPVPNARSTLGMQDAAFVLGERRSLASIYIMCRALIAVMQSISKDALGEVMGYSLEDTTFEQFRKPDLKLLAMSANHRTNAQLYATLLGQLSNVRFVSVTDRFLSELAPVAHGQVPKDLDMKYENLVKGLRYLQIKVWPPESFEEGAEFLESLSKSFENAHGLRLKTAFAESLIHLLHPIGKTAQAEVNHPMWARAIEIIYPKARDMMNKPRYWHVAYPLVVTSLCVAPHEYFLRNWTACFEAGLSKMKEKPFRIPVLNGMMRLIWTYLYRCREANSTATAKLDSALKHFFPANRTSISPHDDHLDPFVYIVHFVLSRHFEYGCDLTLGLLQEPAISAAQSTNITHLLAPERMTIALRAILLSLNAIEREEPTPMWPSSSDFSVVPSAENYPSSSDFVPPSLLSKPGMLEFFDRCGPIVTAIATSCRNSVGRMSVYDDQWSLARLQQSYEEPHNYCVRQHPEGSTAYPIHLQPQISTLELCFNSWPRCLHPTLPLADAVDMLIRGIIHVEPVVGEAALQALRRMAAAPDHVTALLSRFATFLFDPVQISREGSKTSFILESPRLLKMWVSLIDGWIHSLLLKPRSSFLEEERSALVPEINKIESGALFLLSFHVLSIRSVGVQVLRMLERLVSHICPDPPAPMYDAPDYDSHQTVRFVNLLHGETLGDAYLVNHDDFMDSRLHERLDQWRETSRTDVPLRIACSDDPKDRLLWRFVYPSFIQTCIARHQIATLPAFRDSVVAAMSRYHPVVTSVSGLGVRSPVGQNSRSPAVVEREQEKLVAEHASVIEQWHMWMKLLCCTASVSESGPTAYTTRNHSRAPSDYTFDRDRMGTTRGLFKYLSHFLDSDHTIFRDAAVLCISAFPSDAYPQLLEDVALAARQVFDESRTKSDRQPILGRSRRQERLHSAVARIYYLTAHLLQDQRSAGRQAALANVLKFVRVTQSYLSAPETRERFTVQRLRRHFCGIVERLFNGLVTLRDSDRFIPRNMHLSLYRLCEEWCQFGTQSEAVKQRLVVMQTAAVAACYEPQDKKEAIERFQIETKALSNAAVGALSSLCHMAFFPPEDSLNSPTDSPILDYLKPLEASATLDRILSILASHNPIIHERAKKALRSLLTHATNDVRLLEAAMKRALMMSKELDTSNGRFFEVVVEVICGGEHGFTFSQAVLLGLSNLCHSVAETRWRAFDLLEAIHSQFSGESSLGQYEAAVGSSATITYLAAHVSISELLAMEHPDQAMAILSQSAKRLLHGHEGTLHCVPSLLLQGLGFWLPGLGLMTEDNSSLSMEGRSTLYHLMALTLRYAESHAKQVQALWTRLIDSPGPNGHAAIRFLVEQSQKVGSPVFVGCAAKVVACLSRTTVGLQVFEDLCGIIEPPRMLPSFDHRMAFPDSDEADFWADLDGLFAGEQRLTLGAGQFALLFLSDVALGRPWDCQVQLPVLLHALFMHVDHRLPYVRQQSRRMFLQLLRSWVPGYDELPRCALYRTRSALKSKIKTLESNSDNLFWRDDERDETSGPKMKQLCKEVLGLLGALHPTLSEEWGSLALKWGTTCSIRAIAFRSLQVFRALMPRLTQPGLALLLGRLSNTISAPDENIQLFSAEMLQTLTSLAESGDLDMSLIPQMFWCASACLSTTVEREFQQVLALLDSLLNKLDLDDPVTADLIYSHRPPDWLGGVSGLQQSLLTGLRSSSTSDSTFALLRRLAKVDNGSLIDPSDGRVRDLYTVALPWCLHAMESGTHDESLQEFASNIGRLAEREERVSIARITTSFVKGRFRTKDDFLRQAVASLREHYGADYWTEVVTLLMGLVLNQQRWLRVKTMQILKVLFQQRETRNPVDLLGSELLMPLLRLLQTDLASQALEVLEEPMAISGGPAAKHVLHMSMVGKTVSKEVEAVADIFGVPKDTGWCVPQPDTLRECCRANVMAVFDTCKMESRPSQISFQPETEGEVISAEDDLGGLVQNLHELSTFFQEDHSRIPTPNPSLEARVAAILAKSTEPVSDTPETPFVDVFKVGGMPDYDESDDGSDSESEFDAFAFDSPSNARTIRGKVQYAQPRMDAFTYDSPDTRTTKRRPPNVFRSLA